MKEKIKCEDNVRKVDLEFFSGDFFPEGLAGEVLGHVPEEKNYSVVSISSKSKFLFYFILNI